MATHLSWVDASDNRVTLEVTGVSTIRIYWQGAFETYTRNHDRNGDGIFDAIRASHSYVGNADYGVFIDDPTVRSSTTLGGPDQFYDTFLIAQIRTFSNGPVREDRDPYSAPSIYLGAPGRDTVWLDAGRELIYGRGGDDLIESGTGDDRIYGGNGDDRLNGEAGEDMLLGGGGRDKLSGEQDRDFLDGGTGNDALFGGGDSDYLLGGSDKDLLDGGLDNDTLNGGADRDLLTGGGGADRFVFAADALVDRDTITDFSRAEGDRIDLMAVAGLRFLGTTTRFTGAGNEARVQVMGERTALLFDTDGDQRTDGAIFLTGLIDITIADILIAAPPIG